MSRHDREFCAYAAALLLGCLIGLGMDYLEGRLTHNATTAVAVAASVGLAVLGTFWAMTRRE